MTAPIKAIGVRFEAKGVEEIQAAMRDLQAAMNRAAKEGTRTAATGATGAAAMGNQYGQAARQIAFAGESIARMGTVSGEAAKQIISQVAMIGMSFGAGGAIVGAIGVASLAVSEYFTGISRKAKQAADDAIKEFNRMAAGSAAAAAAAANSLVSGDRMVGEGATEEQLGLRRLKGERQFLLRKTSKPDAPDAYDPNVGPSSGPSTRRRADLARISELDAAIAALNERLKERVDLTSELAEKEARAALATAAHTKETAAATKAEKQAEDRKKEAYERSMRDKGYGYSGKIAPTLLTNADKAMFAKLNQAPGFAGPKLDVGLPNQAQLDKDMAKTMADLETWAVDNVAKIKATVADAVRASYSTLANTIADGLSSAFTAGIMGALSGDMNNAMRQWADQMIVLLARGVAEWALKAKLLASAMTKVQAFMTAHPLAAVAAAAALFVLARSMSKGASVGGGYGGGSATASAASVAGGSSGESVTRLLWGENSTTLAAGMTPRQAMNVTIIGPNDASAQRAIQELIKNANRRG